ncbi:MULTISPECIES: type VI secretion system amidase immunity protein Tai4 [unclassified Pseudomonas]|uniref:type VI secretion system amidase immunity protein Tai4 n=1 Tax=unclassified Pseudomonas TaxID=196821 RepID=UPI00215FA4AE|nr:type VI secretion system amidase immunity protein Tai4 [Pseudomonas sp. B21-015]UVM49991.1 type VI secretion system amidase immunity protein Tai4 [Pseudomonas sp. B21-015]
MTRSRAILLLLLFISGRAISAEAYIDKARETLKDYGLANCISSQFKGESEIKSDIGLAIGAYSAMGKGQHLIIQNEDTLEVTHNPYMETEKFMLDAYTNFSSVSKHSDKKMVFYACLEIYNSEELNTFIKSQDQYLPK